MIDNQCCDNGIHFFEARIHTDEKTKKMDGGKKEASKGAGPVQ